MDHGRTGTKIAYRECGWEGRGSEQTSPLVFCFLRSYNRCKTIQAKTPQVRPCSCSRAVPMWWRGQCPAQGEGQRAVLGTAAAPLKSPRAGGDVPAPSRTPTWG